MLCIIKKEMFLLFQGFSRLLTSFMTNELQTYRYFLAMEQIRKKSPVSIIACH